MKPIIALVPLLLLAGAATACGSPSSAPGPSALVKLQEWKDRGGTDIENVLRAELDAVTYDARLGNLTAMAGACGDLFAGVSNAQAYADLPDAEMQYHWGRALDSLKDAAVHCGVGAVTVSPSALSYAADDIDSATEDVAAVAARADEIARAAS